MPSDCFLDKILEKKLKKMENYSKIFLAEVGNEAFGAFGGAGGADVAAVEENPVVGVGEEFGRDAGEEALFYSFWGAALGKADFWGDAEEMGVYRHCALVENHIENDVGGFAADAG